MENTATMTEITGTINQAIDCFQGITELLVPIVTPLVPAPLTFPPPLSIRSLATADLNSNAGLSVPICTELALKFLTNDSFC
jgi:hypothetical protein